MYEEIELYSKVRYIKNKIDNTDIISDIDIILKGMERSELEILIKKYINESK